MFRQKLSLILHQFFERIAHVELEMPRRVEPGFSMRRLAHQGDRLFRWRNGVSGADAKQDGEFHPGGGASGSCLLYTSDAADE